MGLCYVLALVLYACFAVQSAVAAVHVVGDTSGWTTGVNYKDWATNRTFSEGDQLVFTYNTGAHNVMQVSETDYNQCNIGTPVQTFSTGNDRLTLTRAGKYFFVCGTPGHCSNGMSLAMAVPAPVAPSPTSNTPLVSAPAPSPIRLTPSPSPSPLSSPSPSPSPKFSPPIKSPSSPPSPLQSSSLSPSIDVPAPSSDTTNTKSSAHLLAPHFLASPALAFLLVAAFVI